MTRQPLRTLIRPLLAWLAAAPLLAGAASGQFTFVVGDVSLTKAGGQRSVPVKGTAVDPGDRIATGANGMAQLTMVDNARLSLRPATQFVIENYPQQRDSSEGVLLSLVRGTLRTFTGLIASTNRDKFVMKTRVATVGIRGSGNILYACDGADCDPSVATDAKGGVTVNHTIEGSHAVTNVGEGDPGLPPQQGGPQTLITGPGQTVLVAGGLPPRYIPTPTFIADAAITMTSAKPAPATQATASDDTRNFAPSDTQSLPPSQTTSTPMLGNNGLGFANDIEAAGITGSAGSDPLQLRYIIISGGSPLAGLAANSDVVLTNGQFRGYHSYAGAQSGIAPSISGGTSRESFTVSTEGGPIAMGRYDGAGLGFFGTGSETPLPGSIHWINAPAGYPPYLADVLTGTATYTLVQATAPTNQNNTAGTLGSARIDANFTNRTVGVSLSVSIPSAGANPGGSWQLSASEVPISLNAFFGSTADRLVISNGHGNSTTNSNLRGSFEGAFVGSNLGGAILGYGITDQTSSTATSWNSVTGVAAFTGPSQNGLAAFRAGLVSDPAGTLGDFVQSYSAFDRPEEVTVDAQGRVTAFTAPFSRTGDHSSYTLGSAQLVEFGGDPTTGLVWGRWSGGQAVVAGSTSQGLDLHNASLHYIFSGTQNGPVALPLTGSATYDVIGSTTPTNGAGQTGTLNTATLAANFSDRTVDASVNITIANQTWNGAATRMPIYRDQSFSAYTGNPIPGVPNPSPLQMTCTPSCSPSASGSLSGFFAGRTGEGAGLMYNLGGNQGAVGFRRHGGG